MSQINKKTEMKSNTEVNAEAILKKATEINNKFNSLNGAEKAAFVEGLPNRQGDVLKSMFSDDFSTFTAATSSAIITNLPVWFVEAKVIDTIRKQYPLMDVVQEEMVTNGVTTLFYKTFGNADNKSGFSDVVIGDFNAGFNKSYRFDYKVDTEVHAAYDILDSILNDATPSVGMFLSLTSDFLYNIARPMAKYFYEKTLKMIGTVANYDKELTLSGGDTKAKIKDLFVKLKGFETINSTNLKSKLGSESIEHALDLSNCTIIWNNSFAADYAFDLQASTFNIGKVEISVGASKVLDFANLGAYMSGAEKTYLTGLKAIVIENGALHKITQYSASKSVNTPKLKSVFHRYDKFGMFKRLDKMMISVK